MHRRILVSRNIKSFSECLCWTHCYGKGVGERQVLNAKLNKGNRFLYFEPLLMGKCALGVLTDEVEIYTGICGISPIYLNRDFFPIECLYQSQMICSVLFKQSRVLIFSRVRKPEIGSPGDYETMILSDTQAPFSSLFENP